MENQQSPWFEGSVGDAVAKATNEKLLFLSFIYGIYFQRKHINFFFN